MGPISTGLGEVYQYALESGYYCPKHTIVWSRTEGKCDQDGQVLVKSDYDLTGLRTLQNWLITPQLRRLEGVNELNSFGGFVKQFHVVPNPDMLLKYKITAAEILEALAKNNANASGGFLVQDWEQMNVVSKGLMRDMRDIERHRSQISRRVAGVPEGRGRGETRPADPQRGGHQGRSG